MNRLLLRIAAPLLVALCSASFAGHALAQATRTWVSGVGDDVNPCSRTAPCKTFAGAISKTAAHGEISVLDPGGFGAVTITKSITISGTGTNASILAAGVNGIVVNAASTDVVIVRNLQIIGASTGINGISFVNGGELHVDNCFIENFSGQGINFTPSGTSALFVTRTSLRNNATAIIVRPGGSGRATAALDGVRLEGNGVGLWVDDGALATVVSSIASGNNGNGFMATSASRIAYLNLEGTVSSLNGGVGVSASGPQAQARLSNSMVTDNTGGGLRATSGGNVISFGNNRLFGNGGDGAPTYSPGQI